MKICIDPGHGGKDSGAIGHRKSFEKNHTLDIARMTANEAEKYGHEVIMTRKKDIYLGLKERAEIANKAKADLFISIHINCYKESTAHGIETYNYPGSVEGEKLAKVVQKQLTNNTNLFSRGVKIAKFAVLKYTHMTAILVEIGFISNEKEEILLMGNEFKNIAAKAIVQGINEYAGIDTTQATIKGIPLIGQSKATLIQMQAWAKKRNATAKFISAASVYYKYGNLTGLRADILYAQSAKETGFGHYNGAVTEAMNNFAGIKVKDSHGDRKQDHETFASIDDGVRGHFNHLSAYIGLKTIGIPHERFYEVLKTDFAGTIKTVEQLAGRYCPNKNYSKDLIDNFLNDLLNTKKDEGKELMEKLLILESQKFFNKASITDYEGKKLVEDGIIGTRTMSAFDKYVKMINEIQK